jgi:hypothetical protein
MKDLYVRLPKPLRVRVNLAAASADLKATTYVRRQLERWLKQDPLPILPPAEGENSGSNLRFPVTDGTCRKLKTVAIERDISYAVLLTRVLDTVTPHPTELLLEAATGGPNGL